MSIAVRFKHIGIIAKLGDERVRSALLSLLAQLRQFDCQIMADASAAVYLPELPAMTIEAIGQRCELVIIIGGDGTILQAARALAPCRSRLVGINLGQLGFLADISPCDLHKHLPIILSGRFKEEKRFLLRAEAYRGETMLAASNALNDVVLHKWNTAHMFSFKTRIDNSFVSNQRADGMIVSTPTGSTAYGLSVGGPLLHPSLEALLLVFICPHSLSNRPIVVDSASYIEVALSIKQRGTAQMTCDGVLCQELLPGDKVCIRKSEEIWLIHPPGHDYYGILRAKLHWGK